MKSLTLSTWPSAKAVSGAQRNDIEIASFNQLAKLFCTGIKPVQYKVDQKIVTRCWQESRSRNNESIKPPYLITLDYDSTTAEADAVHKLLTSNNINHFIFTTWTHKTIETPQKKNNGLNCFKVMLELTASDPDELLRLTIGLAAIAGKKDVQKVDDISSGIFFGGAHPEFIHEFKYFKYDQGMGTDETRLMLLENCVVEEKVVKEDPLDDFEMWDKTRGQKYTPERIERALSVIKYEEIEDFSKMSIWYSLGYALHSTGESDFFELWDEWCLENCAEHGVYNREENERFWAKQTIPDRHKNLCTLSTLWHLEKIFKAREAASEIRQTNWGFFDILAMEEPPEVKFLIKDLLVENSIGFLVGEGGVGKSSICLEIAKAIASGRNFFEQEEYPTLQGTVAIINKEDSLTKVHNQIHNLVELDIERASSSAPGSDFADFVEESITLTPADICEIKSRWRNVARPSWSQNTIRLTNQDGEDLDALGAVLGSLKTLKQELIETGRPDLRLVIFDPMNMWQGGDQNSQKDMSFMFSAFQQIQKELDVCVLIVHHKNKSKGFSGSHTIRDSGRFMWYLQKTFIGKEESDKYIDFYVEKNNDAKANYTALQFYRTDKGLLDIANIISDEEGEDDK